MDKTKQKLKQARQPDDVSQKEELDALDVLGNWLTKKLKGKTDSGPFSEANLGDIPVKVIAKRTYIKWKSGKWRWKETLSLTTQLIRIARSEMSHIVRDWKAQGQPELIAASHDEDAQKALDLLAAEEEFDEELKSIAYEKAEKRLKDDPEMLKLLHLIRELNDRRAISKRMKVSIVEVRQMEAELLKKVWPTQDELSK